MSGVGPTLVSMVHRLGRWAGTNIATIHLGRLYDLRHHVAVFVWTQSEMLKLFDFSVLLCLYKRFQPPQQGVVDFTDTVTCKYYSCQIGVSFIHVNLLMCNLFKWIHRLNSSVWCSWTTIVCMWTISLSAMLHSLRKWAMNRWCT